MNCAVQAALTPVAVAIKPLLNRLVFHGIETCQDLLDPAGPRVRQGARPVLTIHALATTSLERVTHDLVTAGLVRQRRRAPYQEELGYGERVRLLVTPVSADDQDSPDAVAREFAVLLTRAVALAPDCAVRVSAVPAQLALFWRAHVASGAPITESEWIEDIIELVMGRHQVVDDVSSAPPELRAVTTHAAAEFLADDACRWVLRRTLRDARQVPAVIEDARGLFAQLAALAVAG